MAAWFEGFDAALHPVVDSSDGGEVAPRLPFAWGGVSLHLPGAAELLRMQITPTGDDRVSLFAVDGAGTPVLTVDSLVLRPAAITSK